MSYLLVLQFTADTMDEFNQLAALEEKLIAGLDGIAVVDGHDFGQSEFNIFILTDAPVMAFDKAHPIIRDQDLEQSLRAAYRESAGEDYIVLWPTTLTEFVVL